MTISVKNQTKSRWDDLKPEDMTHDEFAQEVLDAFEHGDDPVVIDTDAIVDKAAVKLSGHVETAAYRGIKDALNKHE
jgi:hypothetical protein